MYAKKLKTNDVSSPIDIDPGQVHFSWICADGQKQLGFQVIVYVGKDPVFDSGYVRSPKNNYCPDFLFSSRTRYNWSITLWDENARRGCPACSHFETGMAHNDWHALWIDPELTHPKYTKRAMDDLSLNKASYLQNTFHVDHLGKARLYATAHGVYDIYINGTHVDGYFMAPGTSAYDFRLQVQTYDIADLLHSGENEILVTLGEGWWRGSHGWSMFRYCYGTDLAFLCQLEIDGIPILMTDENWLASQNGPLEENDTMRMERYDARKDIDQWHEVKIANFGYDKLIGTTVPITLNERFKPKLITTPNGEQVLDFGQNIAGFVELDVAANGDEFIRMQHSDALGKDGNFQISHFQNGDSPICEQITEYICKPGRNVYHQTKCYYGFRYVLLKTDLAVTEENFTAVAIYSHMEQTGYFECGNPDVNKLFQNTLWSMKSNFVDIPTDCPHREKLGFTGDAQVFSEAALYLMDCTPVLSRWLSDVAASQFENGCIRNVVPRNNPTYNTEPVGMDGSAGWCNAFEIVSHRIAQRNNNDLLLKKLYPKLRKWALYNLEKAKESRPDHYNIPVPYREYILDTASNWGEWNEPGRGPKDYFAERDATGHAEVATGYMAHCMLVLSRIADRLEKKDDSQYFQEAYQKVREAYRFVYTDNGAIHSDRQCHYVRAVALELLSDHERATTAGALAQMIRKNGNHIGTGFLTTPDLCNVLTDHGHADTAYDLLLQTKQPGWLYAVQNGATTIWESWYGLRDGEPRGSHNHYSLGAVVGWLMSRCAGIRLTDGQITIRPYPDKRLGFVNAVYHSPAGQISSSWCYNHDKVFFTVEIPPNASATMILPDGSKHDLPVGKSQFQI